MNPLVSRDRRTRALLALEDGTYRFGHACGDAGEAFGEIVFNTSMVGYQEILTDPSYAGQIVTLTYPQQGNYGVCERDMQSGSVAARGLVVRDMCHTPSNWRSTQSLPEFCRKRHVVAIEGVDTRALTLAITSHGAMRAAISTTDLDPESLVSRVRSSPKIGERDLVAEVGTKDTRTSAADPRAVREREETGLARRTVVVYDCGMKRGIEEALVAAGLDLRIVPADTEAEEVLACRPDGVFFSNGPGDPRSARATADACAKILGQVPVFGICLGHQMIGMAAGAETEKLPFGHHGGNEPVMNLVTGKVEITAQNHNFGIVFPSLGPLLEEFGHTHVRDLTHWVRRRVAPVVMSRRHGRVRLTHVNLNDGTCEGIEFLDICAKSVQYHPEASPGPHDAGYLFDAFVQMMDAWHGEKNGTAPRQAGTSDA